MAKISSLRFGVKSLSARVTSQFVTGVTDDSNETNALAKPGQPEPRRSEGAADAPRREPPRFFMGAMTNMSVGCFRQGA
jgi:hypothetical protein